jgi:CHAT domain-containing protein/tetratricopeptide (TPR) repeat protein
MKIEHLFSVVVGLSLLCSQTILVGQSSSPSSSAASQLRAWNWLVVPSGDHDTKSSEEVFAHYESQKNAFASAPPLSSVENRFTEVAFRLARAAFELKKPEFEQLLKLAEEIADREAQSRIYNVARPAIQTHHDLLLAVIEAGKFELALQIADRATARRKVYFASPQRDSSTADSEVHDSTQSAFLRGILKSLGDYEGLEQELRAAIAAGDEQGRRMREQLKRAGIENSGLSSMTGMLSSILLPELAEALAKQGKIKEAKQTLTEYQAARKQEKGGAAGMMNSMFGGARAARDGILNAEVWLKEGKPEKALQDINIALKGQRQFVDWIGSLNAGKPNPLAAYEQVSNCKLYSVKARSLWLLGRIDEALEAQTTVLKAMGKLPPTHPDSVSARQLRAWGLLAAGKQKEAKDEGRAIAGDQIKAVESLLRFASVRQRMVYLQQADPFSLLAATEQRGLLTEAVLRLKGVVLDSMLEEQRLARGTGSPEGKTLLERLTFLRKELDESGTVGDGDAEELRREIEATESKLASLTSSKLSSREALSVTPQQVQAVLGSGDALIEFIRYRHMAQPGKWEPHYGALVMRADHAAEWVPLGEALIVDRLINSLMEQSDAALEADLKMLHARLLQPLSGALGGANRLILAPDGDLGRLSFAVLLAPDGRFVSEHWDLAYVSSARDLLKPNSDQGEGQAEMLILADPDYDLTSAAPPMARTARSFSRAYELSSLPTAARLKGTHREMEQISRVGSSQGIQVKSYTGNEAREEVLTTLKHGPKFLHLATHGYVLTPTAEIRHAARGEAGGGILESSIAWAMPTGPASVSISDNPLQRAVLALAGANTTFAKWKVGEIPPAATDGLLSAAEVATLDLSNTWLAVLSACETASGETLSGEGVIGMRRGFFLAGVDHLVMTFWPIADEETVEVMTDFYKAMGNKVHPATALHRVQRDALVKWRKEHGLLKAVFLAGPFALSTTGKLPPT